MIDKPFSQACENNKDPILDLLRHYLSGDERMLEIGSGTGQHARYFADHFPGIIWQTSDLPENHPGIKSWIEESEHQNIRPPMTLNVSDRQHWPTEQYDAIFTANTLHIMSWLAVKEMFRMMGSCLKPGGLFFCYGPFNRDGQFTSASNKAFDASLRQRDPEMGLRDVGEVRKEAQQHQMTLLHTHSMPANNLLLVFRH